MKKTLYLEAGKDDISKYVIFSGDPFRVEILKQFLDNPIQVSHSREFNTYTGFYKGLKVTITSTGIGSPSSAIAMEEMYECGMEVALRMGTVMSLKEELLGHYIVPIASVRSERTSLTYVDRDYPAVADHEFVSVISEEVKKRNKICDNGLNLTLDGFYSLMKESKLSKEMSRDISKTFIKAKSLGIVGIDMESSLILVLGRLMGVKTAVLTLASVLENLKGFLGEDERIKGEKELSLIALDSIYEYSLRRKDAKI